MLQPLSTSSPSLLRVEDLSFQYQSGKLITPTLEDVSFSIERGKTLAILGPSGCGKTSLLHILAGLLKPSKGKLTFDRQCSLSVIFQNYGLFPWKTVWENVTLGLQIHKKNSPEKIQKAHDLLEELNIAHLKKRFLCQLSEGQRQRLAIARSILLEPDLLLMDEPFSSLDSLSRIHYQTLIAKQWKHKRFSLVLITHSTEEAAYLGQQIMLLSRCPARIESLIDNPVALGDRLSPAFSSFNQHLQSLLLPTL